MRKALLTVALLSGAAGLLALGHPAEVRAQVFCPPPLIPFNGSCVATGSGGSGAGAAGAFSGAALASQALSELSETTTQETTRTAIKAISERREQEEQRCAEGFSRVDGTCQPNPKPVTQAAAVPPAPVPGLAEVHEPKGTKAKAAAARRTTLAAPAPRVVRREPEPPPVFLPVPIEPAIRLGTWAQDYGDYEKRNAKGSATITNPGSNSDPATVDAQSRTTTFGFLAGADLTSRAIIFGNDGLIAGVMAGYVSSNVTVNVSSVTKGTTDPGFTRLHATLSGPTAGLYAAYFNGGFSTDFTFKVDALNLNETVNGVLVFPPLTVVVLQPLIPFSGGSSTSVLNETIAGNLNYRFDLSPNFWIEPTVGAQYTNSSYRSNAADLGLTDGNLVMVQEGVRFGTTALINNRILMTTTLTGLAYDDVLVTGSFVPAATLDARNLFVQADQGHVRGRGILALNLDFGDGISTFAQGEVRGGSGIFGAGGRAGFRVNW